MSINKMPMLRAVTLPVLLLLFGIMPGNTAEAQTGYRQPADVVARILDAPATPTVLVSPDRRTMIFLERPGLPPISDISAPEYRVAGMRLNPRTNGPSRQNPARGLSTMPMAGGEMRPIAMSLPSGAGISYTNWSPDGKLLAFAVTTEDALTLWVADLAGNSARQISSRRLNATIGSPCDWLDNASLVCKLVPENQGNEPEESQVPDGPIIQEALSGRADRVATYQDLLKTPHDEAIFEHYTTSQIAVINVNGGVQPIGSPSIVTSLSASPDGKWILVTSISRPFSYTVPYSYFPTKIEVWNTTGAVARTIATRPLIERVPWGGDAAQTGPRSPSWRADVDATITWVEALDGGDPSQNVEKRDRVLALAAPFTGDARTVAETEWRFRGITWGTDNMAILREGVSRDRKARTWLMDPSGRAIPKLIWDRSTEDRYGDPGNFLTTVNSRGRSVLWLTPDKKTALLTGTGASPEGDRPFLDKIEISSGKTERLFQSTAPYYETIAAILDDRAQRILTRRESVTEPPNYFARDLVRRIAPQQLTRFADPAPQFANVTRERVTYSRNDGVQLQATVYLPPGYVKERDGAIPFLLWAYPREFGSADAASQVMGSPYRFTRPGGSSHLFALLQGYGVMDDPTMPIVGLDGKEPNDTYVEQLVASAEAAVDHLVSMGVGDRAKMAVGGHSYGAFMTANLLAHTNIFRAGIARSGAYNRTLTPFGFQGEQRTYWQAQELYSRMSPFTYADQIKTPILLIHGMADNNTGTYPVQSERMFAALKGTGGTTRYVQLPAESHGYAARESVGHTLFEMLNWLDQWVKTTTMQ